MSNQLPPEIAARIAHWLAAHGAATRGGAEALSAAYKQGAASTAISLAAYLTTRLPATYAAVHAVLGQVCRILPGFAPRSLLDVGAGPGTASFAARHHWPQAKTILVEQDARFAALAQELVPEAQVLRQSLLQCDAKADAVIAAYVFAELTEAQAPAAALHLWQATQQLLVIIEPGTPQGFARLRAARLALLQQGAAPIGPCTHAKACPMAGQDWCHFKTRLARSRAHMQAKAAVVPFEDESYAWLALARQPAALPKGRIIAPPVVNKVAATFRLCTAEGVAHSAIASRNKAAYKQAKKLIWGDGFDF